MVKVERVFKFAKVTVKYERDFQMSQPSFWTGNWVSEVVYCHLDILKIEVSLSYCKRGFSRYRHFGLVGPLGCFVCVVLRFLLSWDTLSLFLHPCISYSLFNKLLFFFKKKKKLRFLYYLPGFEAGGPNIPSNIDPWSIIGDDSSLIVSTDRSSPFERNKIALKMEVLCGSDGANTCPPEGVGINNPGYWGMVRNFFYQFYMYCFMFSFSLTVFPSSELLLPCLLVVSFLQN